MGGGCATNGIGSFMAISFSEAKEEQPHPESGHALSRSFILSSIPRSRNAGGRRYPLSSSCARCEQRLRLLQVGGVKALGKPGVDGCQELAGGVLLPLALPQAR